MINTNLLRGKIAANGYTQEKLASEMNMSKNTLSAKINGRSQFTLDEVLNLCHLLTIEKDREKCEIFLS